MTFASAIWLLAIAIPGRPAEDEAKLYLDHVKPILARRCIACHGTLKHRAGLRLDTAAAIVKGGDSGSAVEPGDSEASLLLDRVQQSDHALRMPPEGEPLKPDEIAAIRQWVEAGASIPVDEPEPADPRKYWSFQAPVRPQVPESSPGSHPIDAFLEVEQRRIGITPRPRAEKAELLRRVTIDLTGLAPSRQELVAFLADPSPDAYAKVVDRLLASPRFGERWGRHWMDVWRYSDWDGFAAEIRESRPQIWHWRDWIVESLNTDLGYDRMITLMLAADEAEPENDSALRASGFLARNWHRFNRDVWLNNAVEHTSKAFLGLTVNCAKCHDHKYDPIAQTDYYRMRAVFEPHQIREDRIPIGPEATKDGITRVYDSTLDIPTYLFERGNEKTPDKSRVIEPGAPAFLSRTPLKVDPVPMTRSTRHPALRDFLKQEQIANAANLIEVARKTLAAAPPNDYAVQLANVAVFEARRTALIARIQADEARLDEPPGPEAKALGHRARRAEHIQALRESELNLAKAQKAVVEARGKLKPDDAKSKTDLAAAEKALADTAAALSAILSKPPDDSAEYTAIGPISPNKSTGRRLALAKWITSKENPLTARVAVNHVWARHFGRPIVASMSDFGRNGKAPTNPALLDWLATELMASNWSLKHIHRLIVTSHAYTRQSSGAESSDQARASDPENATLWEMNARRLEAEAVRDNLLFVSGKLDETRGGPDLDPEAAMTSGRRSLYLRHAQEKRATFLRIFDSPSAVECYRRSESVMPQQALALANSPLAITAARGLAARLSSETKTDDDFITAAFETALNRSATADEREACLAFLKEQQVLLSQVKAEPSAKPEVSQPAADPAQRAREGMVHALFNHSDFVTIR